MTVIDINGLTVAFGEKEIFSGVTLSVQKGQCIGLTGLNGAGKTTLMKAIAGKTEYTSGSISVAKGVSVGYLEQHHTVAGDSTVYEEAKKSFAPLFAAEARMHELEQLMAQPDADIVTLGEKYQNAQNEFEHLGGYGWSSRLQGTLKGLGLNESFWDKSAYELSGGEKTRLALAKMLLENNDVLMLDEPTNHLDLQAAQWLTDYLKRYTGTVILISHDRYMMDKLCDGVAMIDNGKLRYYNGNYTEYCIKWEEELKANQRLYDKQQDEIKRQRAIIARYRRFNREKSIRAAESREKALARMELIDEPEQHADMRLRFDMNRISGGDVMKIHSLSKGFDGKTLFSDFSAEIRQGQRIAIIGPNGAGKTTLVEMLLRKSFPDSGDIVRGVNVDIGYYEQGQVSFGGNETVMDMVWAGNRDLTQTQVRSRCAAMLFFGEDVFKEGKILSGGERARCALCQLSVSGSNTIILDEPTNHLDMDSREVLEDALERFEGTVIAVSHDRYFINRLFDTLWIVENGCVTVFKGNYDDYLLTQKNDFTEEKPIQINKTQAAKQRAQERAAREDDKRKRARIKELEKLISDADTKKEEYEKLFASAKLYSDPEKMRRMQDEYNALCAKADEYMEEWMELSV